MNTTQPLGLMKIFLIDCEDKQTKAAFNMVVLVRIYVQGHTYADSAFHPICQNLGDGQVIVEDDPTALKTEF